MNTELLVALCSLAGSALGTFGGINLINWRLKQLEKRVDKHNNVVERQYKIEENQAAQAAAGGDYVKLQQLQDELAQLEEALEQKTERWMYLTELKEKIDAQGK